MSGPMRGPGGPGRGPGRGPMDMRRAKNFGGTTVRLLGYLRPYATRYIAVIISLVLVTVAGVITPSLMGLATTEIYEGVTSGSIDFAALGRILLTLAAIFLFTQVFNFVQQWMMSYAVQGTIYQIRKDVEEKINRLPLRYFDRQTHGEILSRVTNDVDTINTSLQSGVTQILTSVITLIGVAIMMFTINIPMALIACVLLPLTFLLSSTVIKRSQKHFRGQQDSLGEVNSHVEEMYSGHNVVKVFNHEDESIAIFNKRNDELYDHAWKAQFMSGLMMPVTHFIGNIAYVVVAVYGGMLAMNRVIDVGQIQSFVQYMRQFVQPIGQTAEMINVFQSTIAAAERVFEVLDEPEEVAEAASPVKLDAVRGDVTFEHVRFGYTEDKVLIKDMNINIKSGQRVAIVGPTGAGKTTLINLLLRFYDVTGGSIKIDGVDIRDMRRDDLRDIFGMVLQDTWLFEGTIEENIRYGKLDATHDEVIGAAKAASAHHFIKTLPDGYNMNLNEETSNISQGQRQLFTIARAMLSDPAILILDEATSSVDTRTEILIQKAMDRIMRGRTSFIIAHRLSTIRDADIILVMKDGDIIEQGSHHELMAKGGFYAELYNSQFGGAESEAV